MDKIQFLKFDQINSRDLMAILNEDSLRAHLVDHPYFDTVSIGAWILGKIEIDATQGCRVRVLVIDEAIAGWCGIQPDEEGFEIAIVLSQRFWGSGISIFKTLLCWASELGHKEVLFHLLDSRREYKALARMAKSVNKTRVFDRNFTSYRFSVD